ncbi:MAG TPA: hypothetical protein VG992_00245 [Candidatus Saccharimonadales bacterium]|nr:hypothetical protein [Candidatus Saccharimonadales bacterium]
MSDTSYSGKSLASKLGFAPGDEVYVESTPDWYSDFADESGLELTPGLPATHVHLFCETKADLARFLKDEDISEIEKSLWLSWPKKASGVKADIGEQDLRDALLPLGWVDVKVAAVDDIWSGLKFLRRKH